MRSSGNFGVDSIFYTGSRYPRARDMTQDLPKMSRKVGASVPVVGVDDLLHVVEEGAHIVCVELAVNAVSLPEYQHPENAFYLFGPEDGTLPQCIIDRADDVIFVPTIGCMNLAATVNVVLYDRSIQFPPARAGNELIEHSRDRNNNVEVKL